MAANLQVRDVMTAQPDSIHEASSLEDAQLKMSGGHFRHLPVVNDDDEVVGVLSERDVQLARALFQRQSQRVLGVDGVYEDQVMCVSEAEAVHDVALRMAEGKVGCVVVRNDAGKLVGVFTTTDACRALYDATRP